MKRLIIFSGLYLSLGFMSAVKAQTTPQPTKEPTVYKGVSDQACAIEVSFGSYSAGIDGKAFEKTTALFKKYKVSHTAKGIGREGEQRLCLPLTEIKGTKKKKFIKELKKISKEGQLVSVSIR